MLVNFYIHRLTNDMKLAVQKNHLGGQILYRSHDPGKNGVNSKNKIKVSKKLLFGTSGDWIVRSSVF